MAPPRASVSSQRRTEIAIGLLFVVVLQGIAIALFANFVFDAHYTCDRASDSCRFERVRLFWREVTEEFRPSQIVKASWVGSKGSRALALEMAGGAPEIRIPLKFGGELANRFQEFIANPVQPRFHHVVEWHVGYLFFSGLLQLLAFIMLFATLSHVIKRQRRRAG